MDLTIELGSQKLNIRVAAWIEHQEHVLAVTFPDGNQSLPGGRVQFGETTMDAIQREMMEETGLVFEQATLIAIIENFFTYDGTPFHEYLYVYKGSIDGVQVSSTNEAEQTYRWIKKTELHQLKPAAFQQLLGQNHDTIIHLIDQS